MKFKQLIIKNIGSIESKTIDFSGDILADAPLFLICGPTGSGKSIILDSICLALFGKSARLEKISNRDNYTDKEFNCSDNGVVSLSDARQLVRRGTTNAGATLVFEGNDGKEYTASWSVNRGSKNKLTTRLSPATRSVTSSDGSVNISKVAECNDFIASASVVGLEFKDFCRTTLLAQGEFAKFLDANQDEKANILEKITGTEKFSRIGEAIFTKYKEIKDSAADLLRDINDPEKAEMSEENLQELLAEKRGVSEERAAKVGDKNAISGKKSILERQSANAMNEKDADEKIRRASEKKMSDEYAQARRTSSDWKATFEARTHLKELCDAVKAIDAAKRKEETFTGSIAGLFGNLSWLKESLKNYDGLEKQKEDIKKEIDAAEDQKRALNPEELEAEGRRLSEEKNVFDQIGRQAQLWLSSSKSIIRQELIDSFTPEQEALYRKALSKAEALWMAGKAVEEADRKYNDVFKGFQDHAAAVRATLKKGDICPVCGNTVDEILSDEKISRILLPYRNDIDSARAALAQARNDCDSVVEEANGISSRKAGEITSWSHRNAKVTEITGKILTLTTLQGRIAARLQDRDKVKGTIMRVEPAMRTICERLGIPVPAGGPTVENRELEQKVNELRISVETNADKRSKSEEMKLAAAGWLSEFLAENPQYSEEYLARLSKLQMQDIQDLDKKIKEVDDLETNAKALKQACGNEARAIAALIAEKGYVFDDDDSIERLSGAIADLDDCISCLDKRSGEIEKTLKDNENKKRSMDDIRKRYEEIRPTLTRYETLNSLFGAGEGKAFKKIAQSHLLGVLLENANFYLSQFTDRYELMRQEGSLVVLMKDKQQDDVPRPANTLSGGEGFMASLALALGLSSFNSSAFCSDTIFIDEGFGTLSSNYLTSVYEALASLKKVVGKKVGIISHIEELKEQIHPQIIVEPVGNGLSRINDPV